MSNVSAFFPRLRGPPWSLTPQLYTVIIEVSSVKGLSLRGNTLRLYRSKHLTFNELDFWWHRILHWLNYSLVTFLHGILSEWPISNSPISFNWDHKSLISWSEAATSTKNFLLFNSSRWDMLVMVILAGEWHQELLPLQLDSSVPTLLAVQLRLLQFSTNFSSSSGSWCQASPTS